jgi:uncharacterized protein YdhG (YjbR/CyaY superfamily)
LDTAKPRFQTTEQYISGFPANIAARLKKIRAIVRKAAPDAEELISYNMPAFKLNGPLAYFAAYENHIGLYAMPSAGLRFKKELEGYKTSKGTIQFQHDEPLPLPLIEKVIAFRVRENREKELVRKKK